MKTFRTYIVPAKQEITLELPEDAVIHSVVADFAVSRVALPGAQNGNAMPVMVFAVSAVDGPTEQRKFKLVDNGREILSNHEFVAVLAVPGGLPTSVWEIKK